jgi:hypothetical protein
MLEEHTLKSTKPHAYEPNWKINYRGSSHNRITNTKPKNEKKIPTKQQIPQTTVAALPHKMGATEAVDLAPKASPATPPEIKTRTYELGRN